MTEYRTPHEIRESIRAQMRIAPPAVDHNGISEAEYAARAEADSNMLATSPYAVPELAPAPQVGMKPNPAQGHGGTPAPTQQSHTGSVLERIGSKILASAEALFDNGGGAA